MKRGIETRDLGQMGMATPDRLNDSDFAWQVVRVVRSNAAQLCQQPRRDALGFGVFHAMDHAVPYGLDRWENRLRLQPIEKIFDSDAVVGHEPSVRPSLRIVDRKRRAA